MQQGITGNGRRGFVLATLLLLGGCATLNDFVAGMRNKPAAGTVPLAERPVHPPIDANAFTLASMDQTVVGEPQIVFAGSEDTFSDLARTYGLGYDELVAANPDVDPWLPGENTPVLLPTQFVLPDVPKRGVILNIATKRLFYYPQPDEGRAAEGADLPNWHRPCRMGNAAR